MKVYDEIIHTIEGVRMQCILWAGTVWNIYCNDRFEPENFKIKIHCEICGPKKYVPKVFEYRGHRICNGCLTRFSEMMQAATLSDCNKSREEKEKLKENLKICGEKRKYIYFKNINKEEDR
jgi:hypothetical protein